MEQQKRARGRPTVQEEERLVRRSIRLTAMQWAKIDENGLAWLRKLIQRSKDAIKNGN